MIQSEVMKIIEGGRVSVSGLRDRHVADYDNWGLGLRPSSLRNEAVHLERDRPLLSTLSPGSLLEDSLILRLPPSYERDRRSPVSDENLSITKITLYYIYICNLLYIITTWFVLLFWSWIVMQ